MSDPFSPQPLGLRADLASDKTTVLVTYGLYFAGFVTAGFTTLIGLVMTYSLRAGASEVARSHYVFLARTFWIGLLWFMVGAVLLIVGLPLSLILIGIPMVLAAKLVFLLVAIWYGVRCVLGLIAALADRPHGAPRGWWI